MTAPHRGASPEEHAENAAPRLVCPGRGTIPAIRLIINLCRNVGGVYFKVWLISWPVLSQFAVTIHQPSTILARNPAGVNPNLRKGGQAGDKSGGNSLNREGKT